MSFGKSTQARRDGTAQMERREIREGKATATAHMRDGTIRDVHNLVELEELSKSGEVVRFEKVG